ncbi:MAG: nitrite/sulfite reductase [bacterium]|nr:nitrite/sulfite reductase [bacterium]
MKASNALWTDKLKDRMPEELAREIDIFETEIDLRMQGNFDEKLFAETRLRRGAYGQRYDNGQRHDGKQTRKLEFPAGELTKGPTTAWDAPGMMRIKIPFGGMTAEQLEVMAELAEEYSDGIGHVTTRQDFQLHFIHIEDTPALSRRLAAVDITTREACGNSVRNVTACPIAGCCREETFDVTPYAKALTYFLLGHHDVQDFGRKFKIAFSGCKNNGCGLTGLHDLGLIAKTRQTADGKTERGFEFYVGGGLGAVPHQAALIFDFLPEAELLPMSQAVSRVFSRLGEKKNRARARVKFVVAKLGVEDFRKEVEKEREILPEDPRWTDFLEDLNGTYSEAPLKEPGSLNGHRPSGFEEFYRDNVYKQKQEGYAVVTVKLPLGDITGGQLRAVADIARKYIKDTVRTTVEQNLVLRWVSESDLPALYEDLVKVGLAEAGAGGITDLVACPGTDTCKLGISASRGLAGELRKRFMTGDIAVDDVISGLHIKMSGCFNSCSQHHVADLGFYGVARKVGTHTVPHFQVVLGGQWENNAGSYGLPILAVPSKRIPDVVKRMAARYRDDREGDEAFTDFIRRIGKVEIKKMLQDLTAVPEYESDKSLYSDWRDPREYTTGDMGIGECAGEVVARIDMDLGAAEREVFEAQLLLDEGDAQAAGQAAYMAMVHAAKGLIKLSYLDIPEDPEIIVKEFRKRLYDTEAFFDPYAGGKFANYLFDAHEKAPETFSKDTAHRRIEEASLFVEASHSCSVRMGDKLTTLMGAAN